MVSKKFVSLMYRLIETNKTPKSENEKGRKNWRVKSVFCLLEKVEVIFFHSFINLVSLFFSLFIKLVSFVKVSKKIGEIKISCLENVWGRNFDNRVLGVGQLQLETRDLFWTISMDVVYARYM